MHPVKRSLWLRFIATAQPYFFPSIPGGSRAACLLMAMLLVFLFGVLAVIVAGIALAGQHLAPTLAAEIASGLLSLIAGVLHSNVWLIVPAALVIPGVVFLALGHHLHGRRQAWFLLAIVLFLSLSVTGINVAFSYISNYFTNALVKKNQDMAYLYVAVYFSGFLVGIPVVAFYGYVQNYLGLRWRERMSNEFLGNYLKNRNYTWRHN